MSKPFIIGITGGSGSGKTSFVKKLREDFNENQIAILSQDDYYIPREEQFLDENGVRNFDLLESIDHMLFAKEINELLEGKTITKLQYIFNNPLQTPEKFEVAPAPILIVEGLFVFHFEAIKKLMDLRVFIHAEDDLKIARRIKRDAEERNYPLEDVLYRYENHVLPSYRAYIEPHKSSAHLVVNNNENFNQAYHVIQNYISHKIMNPNGELKLT